MTAQMAIKSVLMVTMLIVERKVVMEEKIRRVGMEKEGRGRWKVEGGGGR